MPAPLNDLASMRIKTRRLARVLTAAQVPDSDIDDALNRGLLYDLPSELKLFNLRKTFTFYTQPNIDTYTNNSVDTDEPLFNFNNFILQSSDPVYIAGYPSTFCQSRQEFFNYWPIVQIRQIIAVGDGITTAFEGVLPQIPVLQNQVQFTSIDSDGLGTGLTAYAVIGANGVQTQDGNLYDINGPIVQDPTVLDPNNTINFVTGVYTINFTTAPAEDQNIYVLAVQYAPARPQAVLFFDQTFTVRPIPDGVYPVIIESQVRPTALIADNQVPELEQWFDYICYLGARRICQDRNDQDTVNMLQPEFERQQDMVLRRTLIQQGDKRAATIYSSQSGLTGNFGPWYRRF